MFDVDLPAVTTTPHHSLQDCSGLVKRTARHYKHPQRAELTFTRGETTGPILHLAVSPDTLNRALLFADTFLRAAADQNWPPIPPREPEPPDPRHYYGRPPEPKPNPGPHYADLSVDGQRIEFLIEEALRVARTTTDRRRARQAEAVPRTCASRSTTRNSGPVACA